MKYAVILSLALAGLVAQTLPPKSPEETTLPNGKRWADAIAEADYKDNLKESRALADLSADIRNDIEASDKFVLSLKTLHKVEEAEKLTKSLRARMRKN